MKRVGIRGEGRFERISWETAIEFIASRLQSVVRQHGPGSVYIQYGTGDCGAISGVSSAQRLMNLLGGYLARYNDYSSACLAYTAPFVTGYRDTSSYQTLVHSKLIILNGFNPAETVFETNSSYYLARAKEAGVGAVATQSFVEPSYGPLGLELMKAGKTAEEALAALLKADRNEDVRQVAMVDAHGRVAAPYGENCIAEAGTSSETAIRARPT
jgi:anaerobic dimethyl sulfoxide reductase subunit A